MAKHNKKAKLTSGHRFQSDTKGAQGKPKPKAKIPSANNPEPTIPFVPDNRILLVGEGDLSFAKSIVEHHGCCDVTATCLDTRENLFAKYEPQAEDNVRYLEGEGQCVLYSVDATKLSEDKQLKKMRGDFNTIIFNFPHVGGKSKDVNRQVRFNQELLVEFFKCTPRLLAPSGTIVVTLFEGEPYTLWNIRDLARHSGLDVQRSFKFQAEAYPGYSHSRTLGNIEGGGGWKGEDRDARSYVFCVKDAGINGAGRQSQGKQQKRKRASGRDSSDDER